MLEQTENTASGRRIARGKSARTAASLMDIGNIVAIIFIPLIILWFGFSMLVYAMNRHHPNPKVGRYTQSAAYRFYGVTGFFVAAAAFIPGGGYTYYLYAWALAAMVIIPWSIYDLIQISRDEWVDIVIEDEDEEDQGAQP
ncbi:MAG: hypothetical protein M3Z21_02235 [Pseudomonadota bacterium]|nr:hypothetical protein [Pseudomonadota bacterium]